MKEKYVITDAIGTYNWRPHYAWFPVKTVRGKWIWLKPIYKRVARFCYPAAIYKDIVQYGTSFDILSIVDPVLDSSTHMVYYSHSNKYIEI
jgi:hypothetical protein